MNQLPEQRGHSLLGASSSARWLACPGSVPLTKDIPDTTSRAAEEGTLAHELAELKTRCRFFPVPLSEREGKHTEIMSNPLYDVEMESCTDEFTEFVERLYVAHRTKPTVLIEKLVDYSPFAPGGYGYVDNMLVSPRRLDVIDYKHGKGVSVDAVQNPQMSLYALGQLLKTMAFFPNLQEVHLHIFQPRNGGESSWETTRDELVDWGIGTVKPVAFQIDEWVRNGVDDYTGKLFPGEKQCRFCKARATCRARGNQAAIQAFGLRDPNHFSLDELSNILTQSAQYMDWISSVRQHCLNLGLSGESIPGWKAVHKQGQRRWADENVAMQRILSQSGKTIEDLYESKPKSLAQIEKLLGKTKFKDIAGDLIEIPQGEPTLVPDTDNRPEVNNVSIAKRAFGL